MAVNFYRQLPICLFHLAVGEQDVYSVTVGEDKGPFAMAFAIPVCAFVNQAAGKGERALALAIAVLESAFIFGTGCKHMDALAVTAAVFETAGV